MIVDKNPDKMSFQELRNTVRGLQNERDAWKVEVIRLKKKLAQNPKDARAQLFAQTEEYAAKAARSNSLVEDLKKTNAKLGKQLRWLKSKAYIRDTDHFAADRKDTYYWTVNFTSSCTTIDNAIAQAIERGKQ
jgi:hypothetical protein